MVYIIVKRVNLAKMYVIIVSMAHFDVMTLGAATQDVFLKSSKFEEIPNPEAPDGMSACVSMGAKIPLDDVIFATGGGATNAAVTFGQLGLKAACVARVGQDHVGVMVKMELGRAKVETRFIQEDEEEKTGYSIIFLSGDGHRSIMTYRGASLKLDEKRLPWDLEKSSLLKRDGFSCDWIYLTSVAGNTRILDAVFSFAEKTGAKVAWNPGNGELALGRKGLMPYLAHTEVLLLNREEAAELAGKTPRHLDEIVTTLAKFGPILSISDGAKGAYVYTDQMLHFAPALPGKRVNTTGAGDAFGSGFVTGLIKGMDAVAALRLGMLNALGVITHMGAKAGLLKKMPTADALARVKIETTKNGKRVYSEQKPVRSLLGLRLHTRSGG